MSTILKTPNANAPIAANRANSAMKVHAKKQNTKNKIST